MQTGARWERGQMGSVVRPLAYGWWSAAVQESWQREGAESSQLSTIRIGITVHHQPTMTPSPMILIPVTRSHSVHPCSSSSF